MSSDNNDRDRPLSLVIRDRLKKNGVRFFANDNIAEHLLPGEQDALAGEVENLCEQLLQALVIDTDNDPNTKNTAKRLAHMYLKEVFAGRYISGPSITEFPNTNALSELILVGPIMVRSACSHHFCPIMGKVWIGILPNKNTNLLGLSKYSRMVAWIMQRPQIQEEAVTQLADLIEEKAKPDGLAVIMEASHFCMSWRGVKEPDGVMLTSIMRGKLRSNAQLRQEFLSLIPKRTKS